MAALFQKIQGGPSVNNWISSATLTSVPELKAADSIPIVYPDVVIAYKTRPPPADQAKLDEWNVDAEKISTVKREVFIVRNPTLQMLQDITEFSGLEPSYRPTNTAITAHSVIPMLEIVAKVSMVAMMLQELNLKNVEMGIRTSTASGHPAPPQDEEMEPGEEREDIGTFTEIRAEDPSFRLRGPPADFPWGTAETLLAKTPSGIFCPFNLDYAAPDPSLMARFIQTFTWFFADTDTSDVDSSDMERYMAVWATEMCNTLGGHHLAHMMVSLLIAYSGGASCYFLQIPDRHYEGCVIVKQAGSITVTGKNIDKVSSVAAPLLEAELREFGFHSVILRKILDLVGATTVTTESVTSMRHLREIVFAGTGMPDGTRRNQISRLLPKLAFEQKVLGVNEASIDMVLRLLTTDTAIPRSLFLATSSFFVDDTDRTRLVLAAWGDEPPTFNYGGAPLMACSIKGQGVGTNVKDYDSNPPRVLQMRRVNMTASVTGWNTLISRGYIWGIYDRKLDRARSFNGGEKTRVWNILAKRISASVVPKGTVPMDIEAPGGSGQKRGRPEDIVGDRSTKKKKGLF